MKFGDAFKSLDHICYGSTIHMFSDFKIRNIDKTRHVRYYITACGEVRGISVPLKYAKVTKKDIESPTVSICKECFPKGLNR